MNGGDRIELITMNYIIKATLFVIPASEARRESFR